MPRIAARVCALIVAFVWSGMAAGAEVACTIKYLSAEHVYLDAGLSHGLVVGLTGKVVRDGAAIAELEIVYTAETSASCTVKSAVQELVAGDTVIFEVAPPAAEVKQEPTVTVTSRTRDAEPSAATRGKKARPRLRGSVAVQWDRAVETQDRSLQTDILRIPFRLQAREVGRGFNFYARGSLRRLSREGFSASTPASEWRNRIQELALVREGRDMAWHLAVGRVGSRVTSTAGPFDGMSISRRVSANTRVGAFGGFSPEWGNLGFGTDDHVAGMNFHLNRMSGEGRLLDLVLAGIGRYRQGEISREYVTLTTTWRNARGLSLLQAAEVDFNRGWRQAADTRKVVLTSLALSGRYAFSRAVALNLGFDNREPVRTWETRSLPDSLFTDAGRKGWRGGLRWRPARRLTLNASGSLRRDDRGGGSITGWNARASAPGLLTKRATVYMGIRGFDGPWLSGWSPSAGVSSSTRSGFQLRTEAGYYRYRGKIDDSTRHNRWLLVGLGKDLSSRFSTSVEYRQDWGDDIIGRRWFVELRRRF